MRNDVRTGGSQEHGAAQGVIAAARWLGQVLLAGLSARAGAVVAPQRIDRGR